MFNRIVLIKKRLVPLFAVNLAIKQSGVKHYLVLTFCFFFVKEKEEENIKSLAKISEDP